MQHLCDCLRLSIVLPRSRRWFAALVMGCASALTFAADAPANWKMPRTEHGHPDLQGFWSNSTLTPFERDAKYGDRLVLTPEEATSIERTEADFAETLNQPTDPSLTVEDLPKDCGRGFTGVNCGYNSFWVDPGSQMMMLNGEYRSSMITTPKNGRVPPLTPAARQRLTKLYAGYMRNDASGPEVRPLGERCIMSFGSSAGPPMLPQLYNNHYQIVQTKDTVMILAEMVHDVRIVHINDNHYPNEVVQWMGNSVGRYEGDTLIIETTNLRPEQSFRGAGPKAKYIEKLTRIGPDTIKYEFTIDDPESFGQAWGGELAFNKTDEQVYEYACHEGNYALPGILAGARKEETDKN